MGMFGKIHPEEYAGKKKQCNTIDRTEYFSSNGSYCHFWYENQVNQFYLKARSEAELEKIATSFKKIDFLKFSQKI